MADEIEINAVHVVSDKKFILWIRQTFDNLGWNSGYYIINAKIHNSIHTLGDNTYEVSADPFGQKQIVEGIAKADIVFHHFLDNFKSEIVLASKSEVLHCWCFYGAEIYQQTNLFRSALYGPKTRQLLWTLPEIKFRYDLRMLYYIFLKRKEPPICTLRKAIPRIHSLLWYVEDEIALLHKTMQLPPYRFFQFFTFEDIIPPQTSYADTTSKRILIGNSATIENNHVDVINVLKELDHSAYHFTIPLTYGQFKRYKTKIKKQFTKVFSEKVFFLEAHMPLQEYYTFLLEHPTAIFLHYRQQGLGNILYLLYAGTKVYLSDRNIVYSWLKKHDIAVFAFEEQFKSDMENHRLTLTLPEVERNRRNVKRLLEHTRNNSTIHELENAILLKRTRL